MGSIGAPGIEWRPAQAYMGIRFVAPFRGMSKEIASRVRVLDAWLKEEAGINIGPPFLRYHVIDMNGLMDLSYCVPVRSAVKARGVVTPGELPAGRYARLVYSGGGIAGNRALIEWVRAQGLDFDRRDTPHGDSFQSRYETYLTDPSIESRRSKWQIEVAIKLAE